ATGDLAELGEGDLAPACTRAAALELDRRRVAAEQLSRTGPEVAARDGDGVPGEDGAPTREAAEAPVDVPRVAMSHLYRVHRSPELVGRDLGEDRLHALAERRDPGPDDDGAVLGYRHGRVLERADPAQLHQGGDADPDVLARRAPPQLLFSVSVVRCNIEAPLTAGHGGLSFR